jgi:hypothetical protein
LLLLLPVGFTLLGVGSLVVLWGEHRCLHLKLPLGMTRSLPGHRWLRAAYACHLGGVLGKLGRSLLPPGMRVWAKLATLPVQVLGFVFLLLFLRKLADVIARGDLKRLIDVMFGLVALTLICGAVIAGRRELAQLLPHYLLAPTLVCCWSVSPLSFLGAVTSYLVLLRRMSAAVAGFASFLASEPFLASDPPDEAAAEAAM